MSARVLNLASSALAAVVVLIAAPTALAAPPTCTTPQPAQTVQMGDQLFFIPACSDPDVGDVLEFAVTTAPAHGDATGGSEIAYAPNALYTGPDQLALTATDGTDTTVPVTVDITVENSPPSCETPLTLEVVQDQPTLFDPYFTCEDQQFLETFSVVTPPDHGDVSTYDIDEGFTYTPDAGYVGPDSFTFVANDGVADSNLVTVNIVVSHNDAPHCVTPITVRVAVGGAAPLDYRTSCTDPDGDALSPELVTGPSHGTLDLTGLPIVTYRPAAGYTGPDLIRYRVRDNRGAASNVATVNLIVGTTTAPAPPPDTTGPALDLARAGAQKLRAVRTKGLRLTLTSNEAGTARIEVSVSKATARKLRINRKARGPVVIGRATKPIIAGENTITVKLNRKARKRLARASRVKLLVAVRVVDAAGNAGTDTLRITLRR